jgi:hypothetical protein
VALTSRAFGSLHEKDSRISDMADNTYSTPLYYPV